MSTLSDWARQVIVQKSDRKGQFRLSVIDMSPRLLVISQQLTTFRFLDSLNESLQNWLQPQIDLECQRLC